jgi:hypothetical protein
MRKRTFQKIKRWKTSTKSGTEIIRTKIHQSEKNQLQDNGGLSIWDKIQASSNIRTRKQEPDVKKKT